MHVTVKDWTAEYTEYFARRIDGIDYGGTEEAFFTGPELDVTGDTVTNGAWYIVGEYYSSLYLEDGPDVNTFSLYKADNWNDKWTLIATCKETEPQDMLPDAPDRWSRMFQPKVEQYLRENGR